MTEVRSAMTRSDLFDQRIRERRAEVTGRRLDVLVAGCGFPSGLTLDRAQARVVGVDEDLPAVRASMPGRKEFDSWALGDLRTVPVPPRSFDVACISFLLERVRHPELVLDRLLAGLRPGGLALLRMRDRSSAYGMCDRLTPSLVRRLLWRSLVPKGTVGPLPTVYGPAITREGIHAFCLARGLMVTDEILESSGPAAARSLGRAACSAVEAASGGRFPASHDEISMVIRKPENHFARLV
ncbi:methyltransferase domain-containing protein [Planomonospora sp. ID67723]|uniref:class I SAM-dependent methyltransferase n=1 Tax=Planomonospora sp. ID67723 TaxID=2738134 RepID=UPI0018C3BF2F|nr:methyltransferase domain-containing protein [Planomonospora sp. ID67723]MBG0826284.1 methyltransferase domain-containing protein [Planomonospora sp. ID67723]